MDNELILAHAPSRFQASSRGLLSKARRVGADAQHATNGFAQVLVCAAAGQQTKDGPKLFRPLARRAQVPAPTPSRSLPLAAVVS
jgi:hypothetical protein